MRDKIFREYLVGVAGVVDVTALPRLKQDLVTQTPVGCVDYQAEVQVMQVTSDCQLFVFFNDTATTEIYTY